MRRAGLSITDFSYYFLDYQDYFNFFLFKLRNKSETNLYCILAQGTICVVVIPVDQVPVLLLHVEPRAEVAAAPAMVGRLPHVHKSKEGQKSWKCGKADGHVDSNWLVVIVLFNWLITIIVALIITSSVNRHFGLNFQASYLPWLGLQPRR